MSKVKFTAHLDYIFFFHSEIYNCKCAYLNFENLTPSQLASEQWYLFRLWQLENEELAAFANPYTM
jgi:hypothetical protein